MTSSTATIALSDLARGDLFSIDGAAPVEFIARDDEENGPAVRLTVRDPQGHPAHRRTIQLADVAEHAFTRP